MPDAARQTWTTPAAVRPGRVAAVAPATLRELLDRQAGVLARRQALAAGLSPDAWQWRLTSGRWQSLLPGVAVAYSGGVSEEQLAWAAVLWCGPGAALTGDAALRAWGARLPAPDHWHTAVEGWRVVEPQRSDSGPPTSARLLHVEPHRVVRLPEVRHPTREPAAVRPAAALLHAAAWARSARAAEWRVAALVQQRLVTPDQVRAALQVLTRTQRRALVRDVLDDVELGAHARSELDLLAFLRRHALPLPDRLQRPVRRATGLAYVDAYWERPRVGLEVDGAHHREVATWEADLLRSAELSLVTRDRRGLLLRLTPGHLRHDEQAVAALLHRALR